mgnify:CR=1 FL=1
MDLTIEIWTTHKIIGYIIKVKHFIIFIGDLSHDMKARYGKLTLSNG